MRGSVLGGERLDQDLPRLPRVTDPPPAPAIDETAADNRNPMFGLLVEAEADVTGLLAYGLYKQNKRDWLIAHRSRTGREPTEAELEAFILGERLPRRIATYRRLAQDLFASDGTAVAQKSGLLDGLMAAPANDASPQAALAAAARKPITWRYIGLMLAMLVVMAIVFRIAAGWLFGTGR
jgi:hypothetical protein